MTQKDLINEIREEQKRMAIEQLNLATNLSNFINKQDTFNQRITDLLETNPLTKRKGIVEDLEELKPRVDDLEIKNKVTAGKITIGFLIFTTIGGVVWKLLTLLD
jgi:hypothetical protein